MAQFYVHCEVHGKIEDYYSDPNNASRARTAHRMNIPKPHGTISVIEEYPREKYGQELITVRKYRK